MSLFFNGTDLNDVYFNGVALENIYMNNVLVWTGEELVLPDAPTNVNATDDQEGQVTITFTQSTVGSEPITYNLWQDGLQVSSDIETTGHVHLVDPGVYEYKVSAVNGLAQNVFSEPTSGESLVNVVLAAPNAPTNVTATDNIQGRININWTESTVGNPVPTYDIYEDGALVFEGAGTPFGRIVSEGTYDYVVRAINSEGNADSSPPVSGTSLQSYSEPDAPTNFVASDNVAGAVVVTWTDSTEGFPLPTYGLYENGIAVPTATNITSGYSHTTLAGTKSYYVRASNIAGFSNSNSDNGTSLISPVAPNSPTNFTASDDRAAEVVVEWTNSTAGYPIPTYNLYEDGALVQSDITSGYVHSVVPGTRTYYVRAVNSEGSANSNTNSGTSVAVAPAGSQTFYDDGVFVVPTGHSQVTVCMIGGGGSGSVSSGSATGGGYAGEIISQTYSVTSGASINVVIGAGGDPRIISVAGVGNAGTASTFGTLVANGGAGGTATGFLGNLESVSNCAGTFSNGWAYAGIVYGGQAGFGNGGDGDAYPDAGQGGQGPGAGGGGVYTNGSNVSTSGFGSEGMVRISWG